MKKIPTDKELIEIMGNAIKGFKGDATELEAAIGLLFVSRKVGWKPMYLIHTKKTIKKYEKILGISIRDFSPEEGELAHKSVGYKLAQGVSNFWKAVQGDISGIRSKILQR